MNYIVFDMEWNQPYPGEKLVYRNDLCINNEIIQIGAVMLDEKCRIIDTFSINIKPSLFRKLNHNVKKLTGIDQALLDSSEKIEPAVEKFRKWCGDDFVFVTWGYDDIGVLGSNLKYFDLDTSWLPECYNLQMIFCAQTDNENRQYSLSYAAEYFQIVTDKPLHNALTDAYYTALVCQKLDMSKGISEYRAMVFKDKSIPEHMKNIIYKRSYKSCESYEKIVNSCGMSSPVCCECGKQLEITKKAANGLYHHLVMGKCSLHGEYAHIYKLSKNAEKSFSSVEQCFEIDDYNKGYFLAKAKKMLLSDSKRKQRTDKTKHNNSLKSASSLKYNTVIKAKAPIIKTT